MNFRSVRGDTFVNNLVLADLIVKGNQSAEKRRPRRSPTPEDARQRRLGLQSRPLQNASTKEVGSGDPTYVTGAGGEGIKTVLL